MTYTILVVLTLILSGIVLPSGWSVLNVVLLVTISTINTRPYVNLKLYFEDLEKRNLEHTMSIPMGKSFVTRGIALATSNGGAPINHSVVLTLL